MFLWLSRCDPIFVIWNRRYARFLNTRRDKVSPWKLAFSWVSATCQEYTIFANFRTDIFIEFITCFMHFVHAIFSDCANVAWCFQSSQHTTFTFLFAISNSFDQITRGPSLLLDIFPPLLCSPVNDVFKWNKGISGFAFGYVLLHQW